MKIQRIFWLPFRLPYTSAFTTAHGSEAVREGVLLRLVAESGLEGIGEASPVTAFGGGTAADALRLISELAPRLVGLDLDRADAMLAALEPGWPGVDAAACALDTAICDMRARAAGITIAQLLGGDPQREVAVNATVGAVPLDAACAAARRAAEAGFGCVKLKVGVTADSAAEVARIAVVREAIGPAVRLRIDANGAWDVAGAIALLWAAERYELELVEQPVAADDLAGMARVRAAVGTPIAADEAVGGLAQARRVADAGAADILVVKPLLAGGLRPAREVIALAREAGLGAFVTSTIDSGVGVAAVLHLATALPAPALACGLATGPLLAGDLLARPLGLYGGAMSLPAGAGLGIALDERQIARYGDGWRECVLG
jgi:o-succinylbenzoate synthase